MDFTGDPWHSLDDMPTGPSDPDLERFSIEAAGEDEAQSTVAFENPGGGIVLIIVNSLKETRRSWITFESWGGELAAEAQSVRTVRWR